MNNPITFAGYQYDKETGLYYLNARMYNLKIASFLQEDSYRGDVNDPLSLNLYTYCKNEPLMYSDPTGHMFEGIKKAWKDYKSDFAEGWDTLTNETKRNEAIDLTSNYGDGSLGESIVKGVLGVPNDIKNSDKNYDKFNKTFNIDNKAVRVTEGIFNGFGKFGIGFIKGTAFLGKTIFDGGGLIGGGISNKLGQIDNAGYNSIYNNLVSDLNTWKQAPGGIWDSGVNVLKTTPRLFTDPNISEEDVSNLTSNAIGTAFVLKGSHDLIQNGGNNLINGLSNMKNIANNGGLQLATADGLVGSGSNAAIMTSPIAPSLGGMGSGIMYTSGRSGNEEVSEASSKIELKNGMTLDTNQSLVAADDFLGKGYKDMGNGRFVSADGTKQVRMTDSDLATVDNHAGAPHMNFEIEKTVIKPNGKSNFIPSKNGNMHILIK